MKCASFDDYGATEMIREISCRRSMVRVRDWWGLLFSLLFAHTAAYDACADNGHVAGTYAEYDSLVLSMMWPFSSCVFLDKLAGGACQSPPANFVVRGLWPVKVIGEQPLCCGSKSEDGSDFKATAILDLAPQLRHLFPDLSFRDSDTDLWKAQWEAYGACTGLTCRAYFRRIVELSRRFDFMRAFSAQGIVASDHRIHKLSTVQRAANAAVGGSEVRIRCRQSWLGPVLDAIHVCLDATSFHVVDCPASCPDSDIACCPKGSRLTMPFWGRDNGSSGLSRNSSSSGHPNGKTHPGDRPVPDEGIGYWIGQVAVALVLFGGVAFWVYSTIDRRRAPASSEYQRI